MAEISQFDSRIFWGTLYLTPAIWIFFFIVGILRFKFEYLPVIISAILMNGANIFGYMKCSNSAKNKMKSVMEQGIRSTSTFAALNNNTVVSWLLSSILAITTNEPANNTQK